MTREIVTKLEALFGNLIITAKPRAVRARSSWTMDEDVILRVLGDCHAIKNWMDVAKAHNSLFEKERTASSCRQRYHRLGCWEAKRTVLDKK